MEQDKARCGKRSKGWYHPKYHCNIGIAGLCIPLELRHNYGTGVLPGANTADKYKKQEWVIIQLSYKHERKLLVQ